ncbi:4336_t:CDS:2 [Paraglomus occultum]|uniref:4336_t:CDS:1 n=1 Tax=Paraglomus occultum TaxID=144539 RepID=A0A9N9ARL9_9GLOM|nr:4336_t:CDS:2 [Paraglomus occultum]
MSTEESGTKKIKKRRKHKQSSKESGKRSGLHNAIVSPCDSATPEPASPKTNEGSQTSEEPVDIVDISNKKAPKYTEQEIKERFPTVDEFLRRQRLIRLGHVLAADGTIIKRRKPRAGFEGTRAAIEDRIQSLPKRKALREIDKTKKKTKILP